MNTLRDVSFNSSANVFSGTLSLDDVRERAPAIFADAADERLSSKYTFIPTAQVLSGLMRAGFVAVQARQVATRRASPLHALHAVRLRRRYESISLRDSVPEILLWNSHNGKSHYELRMMVYRAVCTNGLIVSRGAFPTLRIAHRGDIVNDVVTGALEISERFDLLAAQVERMEARRMLRDDQIQFAERALALKYPDLTQSGMKPSQLLTIRRPEDVAENLYTVLNRVQENLTRGGLIRRSGSGRLLRTRRVTSIRSDIRLNAQLWDLATEVLAA
jgi:hypothetical protein